jgi:hypothetical protein
MDKIILKEEDDLQPLGGDMADPIDTGKPIDDLDLEGIVDGDDGEMGDVDYQYRLKVKQAEDEEGAEAVEPAFTFILEPKDAEGEEEIGDLEEIEGVSDEISAAQSPDASVPPAPQQAPLPESVWSDLEPILEQEAPISAAGGENTAPPPPPQAEAIPAEEPLPAEDEAPLEEVAPVELSEEDLKSFIEGGEFDIKYSIDDETEFSLDEAMDYLKLYPETEVFVTIKGDLEDFKTKLDEFTAGKEEGLEQAGEEDQNVMVDDGGESLDMKTTPNQPAQSPSTPGVPKESFSIFNFRGKKNLPDGIYLGHLAENKLYGRVDLKLTANKLVIGKDIFQLEEKVDIAASKDKEVIELVLKEGEADNLVKLLSEKADITVKL